jgi:glutaredoxin
MQSGLRLYGKAECGLCEQAHELLAELGLQADSVNVEADDELMAVYGLRIPVLADAAGRELGWPFDIEQLQDWIEDGR